jgi:hypothetical protein
MIECYATRTPRVKTSMFADSIHRSEFSGFDSFSGFFVQIAGSDYAGPPG